MQKTTGKEQRHHPIRLEACKGHGVAASGRFSVQFAVFGVPLSLWLAVPGASLRASVGITVILWDANQGKPRFDLSTEDAFSEVANMPTAQPRGKTRRKSSLEQLRVAVVKHKW
ncbi:hypothetical protein PF008_g21680 [Phytophthora fragariae]|uniref:Uncharacterized protein n=1 Tax=Phytophthora fragariae TaxID=53985 RepID=A0A6G0QWW8_9STRA|nr:hypothetical protein PF008_g21680 [Phytophthora fragariae]